MTFVRDRGANVRRFSEITCFDLSSHEFEIADLMCDKGKRRQLAAAGLILIFEAGW